MTYSSIPCTSFGPNKFSRLVEFFLVYHFFSISMFFALPGLDSSLCSLLLLMCLVRLLLKAYYLAIKTTSRLKAKLFPPFRRYIAIRLYRGKSDFDLFRESRNLFSPKSLHAYICNTAHEIYIFLIFIYMRNSLEFFVCKVGTRQIKEKSFFVDSSRCYRRAFATFCENLGHKSLNNAKVCFNGSNVCVFT